jgi:hypothetical protein
MPKASVGQESFNGGQLGPLMRGRVSHPKYVSGAETFENFWATIQGPGIKRPGTRFVRAAKHPDKLCRLVEFEFSVEQTYVLELGDLYMRVYKDGGAVTETAQAFTAAPTAANPVVVTIAGHTFLDGDEIFIQGSGMGEINGRWFTVANKTANDFELAGEDGTGRSTTTGGTAAKIYEIATPFEEANLRGLSFAQSADVLYVASKAYAPRQISRTGDAAWTVTETVFDWPAFRKENQDEAITMYCSHATGSGRTLTAVGGNVFTADMVGSYVQLRELPETLHPKWTENSANSTRGSGWGLNDLVYYEDRVYEFTNSNGSSLTGYDPPVHEEGTELDKLYSFRFINYGKGYVQITAYSSPTVVTVDVIEELPASVVLVANATQRWSIGAWNDEYGYPGALGFLDDRLYYAGTTEDPQTFWGSWVGRYQDFRLADEDDAAVQFTLNVKDLNRIDWIAGEDVFFMGTKNGEFVVSGPGIDDPISGSSVPKARRRTKYGTKENVDPVETGPLLIFTQQAGRKLIALVFDEATQSYVGQDLTRFSDNIVSTGVLEIKAADEPFRQLVAVQESGVPAFLTLSPEEDVIAWSPCPVGGTAAVVESVAVIPHQDGDRDQIWISVSRTVNGATTRHIEYFEKEWIRDVHAVGDEFYLDAGLTYSGTATLRVFGLDHLIGETVQVLLDGGVHEDVVVAADGSVTFLRPGTKIQIGLKQGNGGRYLSMPINAGAGDGTAMGKTKRIQRLACQVYETGEGLQYGPNFDTLEEFNFRTPEMDPDLPVPKFTGFTESVAFPGGYEQEGQVAIVHDTPLPCTLQGVYPQLHTQDR